MFVRACVWCPAVIKTQHRSMQDAELKTERRGGGARCRIYTDGRMIKLKKRSLFNKRCITLFNKRCITALRRVRALVLRGQI